MLMTGQRNQAHQLLFFSEDYADKHWGGCVVLVTYKPFPVLPDNLFMVV